MSITTIASPAAFADNLGLLTMPSDCQGYFLLGTDQASSVVDQMGGAPLTIVGTADYKQGYADFRAASYGEYPAVSPSRDRTILAIASSPVKEEVFESPNFVWPPTLGPTTMRQQSGQYLMNWNNNAQFLYTGNGTGARTDGNIDITTSTAQKNNDPIAYTDGTFSPNFYAIGLITGPTETTLIAPVGRGYVVITRPHSASPAAASKTQFGNKGGPANSHGCVAAIAQFPALTVPQAIVRLNVMLTDVSRRLGYRLKLGDLDAAA